MQYGFCNISGFFNHNGLLILERGEILLESLSMSWAGSSRATCAASSFNRGYWDAASFGRKFALQWEWVSTQNSLAVETKQNRL